MTSNNSLKLRYSINKLPFFNGERYNSWKMRMTNYLIIVDINEWASVKTFLLFSLIL